MRKILLKKLILASVFLALGLVLPFFTGQIKEIGDTLLPMHLPAFLCGLICGPIYGGAVGLIMPLLRSFTFGMPQLYPTAICMALELATYGAAVGIFNMRAKRESLLHLYVSLILAMLCGRIVWGVIKALLLGGEQFTMALFITGGFVDALPGIILQLILIPLLMKILWKTGLVPLK